MEPVRARLRLLGGGDGSTAAMLVQQCAVSRTPRAVPACAPRVQVLCAREGRRLDAVARCATVHNDVTLQLPLDKVCNTDDSMMRGNAAEEERAATRRSR